MKCDCCGHEVDLEDSYVCFECEGFVCDNCYDEEKDMCTACVTYNQLDYE